MLAASRKERLDAWKRCKKRVSETSAAELPATKKSKVVSSPTPTKLDFTGKENSSTSNRPTAQSIKEKLVASAKKRKQVVVEVKPLDSPKPAVTQVRQKNLNSLVEMQVSLVRDMLKIGNLKKARDFLHQLYEETPDCLQVGEFWISLADIEIKEGNISRAKSAFVQAMSHLRPETQGEFNLKCSEFMKREIFHGQPITALDDLLVEPFAAILGTPTKTCDDNNENDEDIDLSKYLGFNPNTTLKKSANKRLTGKKAARVPVDSSLLQAVLRAPNTKKDAKEEGSVIVMEAVKTKKRDAAETGSAMSMTPVRRSARKKTSGTPDIRSVLKQTDFTYIPNRALSTARRSSVRFQTLDDVEGEDLL